MYKSSLVILAAAVAAPSAFAQDFGADVPPPGPVETDGDAALGSLGYAPEAPWSATEPCDLLCDDCQDVCGNTSPIRLRFGVPGWLPEMHGSAAVRGREAPVYVTTREQLKAVEDLNFAFAGRVEADAGRWGLISDGLYVNLAENRSVAGDRIDISAGFEMAVADAAVTYDLADPEGDNGPDDASAELLAGGRYWLLGADGLTLTGPRGNSVTASGSRQWVDPIVGGRFSAPLNDALLMRLRADVGGFGAASDFTWNVEAVGEYRCSERCGLQAGYRVLDVDYARGDGFAYDVNYRGPIVTLVFDF